MRWNHYISYFFGGAFLANAIPHLVSGVTGHPFQSPFAHPPGQGLSSATVNVLWGAFMPVMFVIGLTEGIIYLTWSDEAFGKRYVQEHRGWF